MKILVFSDSHGKDDVMRRLMMANREAVFFHLGDGAPSFLALSREFGVAAYAVRGNCDFFTGEFPLEKSLTVTLENYRFFLTHGDAFGVGGGLDLLAAAARREGCQAALFGHTHVGMTRYLSPEGEEAPLYLFNPGSIARPRDGRLSYGVITIVKGQILFNIADADSSACSGGSSNACPGRAR